MYLLVVTGLLLALLLGQFLAWALLQPTLTAAPTGTASLLFWLAQVGGGAVCILLCLVGFKPGLLVAISGDILHVEQGGRALELPLETVTAARTISALRFHQHYARYAATHVFVSRLPDEVLLLETTDAPVIIGLFPDDRTALLRMLEDRHIPASGRPAARVA